MIDGSPFLPFCLPVLAALVLLGGCAPARLQSDSSGQISVRLPGEVEVARRDRQLRYAGEITPEGVAAVRALGEGNRVDELLITSTGGEINAGMDLGEWVHERGLSVVVEEYCLSSCANYVFTAAWQKVLGHGAVVAWHGSARQQDLPSQLVRVVDDQIKAMSMSDDARNAERARRQQDVSRYLTQSIERQDAFFARIGVSEYVTRVGQERYGVTGLYTLSVPDMRRFGIENVVLPAGDREVDTGLVQQKLDVRIVRVKLDESPLR